MATPVETTQAFYELFMAGKIDEMLTRYVSEDCVLENYLPEPIQFGGRFEGREGYAAYLTGIMGALEIERFEIDEIICQADRVVVIGSETSRVLSTGRSYTMDWVHAIRIRNGMVCEFHEYNDTAAMLAAFTV